MTEKRPIDPSEDPVCGMTVDPDEARQNALTLTHEGTEYAFCGKGCLLEFRDDPTTYLDPTYSPSMERPRLRRVRVALSDHRLEDALVAAGFTPPRPTAEPASAVGSRLISRILNAPAGRVQPERQGVTDLPVSTGAGDGYDHVLRRRTRCRSSWTAMTCPG